MRTIRRILVGTDLTPGAVQAARRALRLPLAPAVVLDLVHAVPRIAPRAFEAGVREAALAALDRQAKALGPHPTGTRIRIRKTLASGPPAEALAREARSRRSELVVIGARGRREIPDLDLGSTAERLLAESTVPVLIARRRPARRYRHTVVAVDLGGSSDAALAFALRLVGPGPVRVTLLHAVELPAEAGIRLAGTSLPEYARLRERAGTEAKRVLAGLMTRIRRTGIAADCMLADADPRVAVLAAIGRRRADLVALGTRRARDRTGFLIGSVARWVARRARCDVLVARARRASASRGR